MTKEQSMVDRFAELTLHLCAQSRDDERFGVTKLNKLLFLVDAEAFRRSGKTITGVEYQKLPHGPCPRPMVPVLRKLEASGELSVEERDFHGRTQRRPVATRAADLSLFSDEELGIVEETVSREESSSASELSERTHRMPAWRCVEDNDTIPLDLLLVESADVHPASEEVLAWAASLEDPFATVEEPALAGACP